jgi:transcriptional regulator with XRE-family HTH domain
MSIGQRIREERERAVLTQAELAEAAAINRSSLSMIESGREAPRPSTIRKIAQALGIPATALVAKDAP